MLQFERVSGILSWKEEKNYLALKNTFRRSECPKALEKKLRRGNKRRPRSNRVNATTKGSSKIRTRKADKRLKRSVRRDKQPVGI